MALEGAWNAQFSQDYGAYNGTALGTAAGTAVLAVIPAFLSHVNITNRPASGSIIFYDSNGTSANTLGTYLLGTSTANDSPPTINFKWRTKTALTIAWSANVGLQAFYLP